MALSPVAIPSPWELGSGHAGKEGMTSAPVGVAPFGASISRDCLAWEV